jgi:tRNA (guanine37-N1)-methyltransferase
MERPRIFNHYVMNLPASAITFLDAFRGLFHGKEELFQPHSQYPLPMIHVHCFSTKSDDNVRERYEICDRISEHIGHTVRPSDPEVHVYDVRDVAPQKRMFCASFRLPAAVAFAPPRT